MWNMPGGNGILSKDVAAVFCIGALDMVRRLRANPDALKGTDKSAFVSADLPIKISTLSSVVEHLVEKKDGETPELTALNESCAFSVLQAYNHLLEIESAAMPLKGQDRLCTMFQRALLRPARKYGFKLKMYTDTFWEEVDEFLLQDVGLLGLIFWDDDFHMDDLFMDAHDNQKRKSCSRPRF